MTSPRAATTRSRSRPWASEVRPLRWGMIGGGEGAFIGAVHRMAARARWSLSARRRRVLVGCREDASARRSRSVWMRRGLIRRSRQWSQARRRALTASKWSRWSRRITCTTCSRRRCLEAGLDVICDKPLTTNLADAEKLVKLARRKEAVVRRHVQLHRLPDDPACQAAHRRRY